MEIWQEIVKDRDAGTRRLVSEYGNRVYEAAYQLTKNAADAEDLVFRTFSYIVRKIHVYDGRCSFFSWIYMNLINFRRMDLRKKGANALVFMEQIPDSPDPAPDPAEHLALESSSEYVIEAVQSLPEELRVAIVLYYFEDFSIAEISNILALPTGTVKYRLYEARKRLAQSLKPTEFQI